MKNLGYTDDFLLKQGNTFNLIKDIDDNSIQLIVTSPPYNIGKVYEKRQKLAEYLKAYADFAKELYKKIAERGHVCWEVGNYVEDGEAYPLDIFFYNIFKDAGFKLRNRIIWHFEHGLHASKRLSGRYETILWFSKSDNYTFNLDPIRVPSKYPGKRSFKGANKGLPSGNPLGKNPSDFWKIIESDWDKEIWEIPNVKANHPEKTIHPCQFPIELVQRCILALTNENDLVFDPFMGIGSSAIASLMHQRRFLGFELDKDYIKMSQDRIQKFQNGLLKIRPLGKPVYQPTGREKVSQVPTEWSKLCE
ncbi:site-specific DNA-methyltransferase [Candidatus Daviesbacteria bacterium]|nr:site-specific DNA-methyltransferase [Candidatus Daviesbacteria bacterium]